MPLLDMPLSKLREYNGTNPKPDDFEEYWDRAIAEMKEVDPQIELKTAAFSSPNAKCYDLYFTGVGGARIYAKYIKPENASNPHPAVVQFHGYSGNSGDWNDKLSWIAAGYSIASLDCRGQGGLSEDTGTVTGNTHRGHIIRGINDEPDKLLFRQIFLDTAMLAGIVMSFDEVDENRVGALGGSQGGGLTLACAALEPRIKMAAPMFPFLCDYKRIWEMDLAEGAYAEIREHFRRADPTHAKEDEIWNKLGYIDVQHLAGRIKGEIMMATGLMDNTCPPSTQFAAFNKITSKKEVVIYPDFGHEGIPGFGDKTFEFLMKL